MTMEREQLKRLKMSDGHRLIISEIIREFPLSDEILCGAEDWEGLDYDGSLSYASRVLRLAARWIHQSTGVSAASAGGESLRFCNVGETYAPTLCWSSNDGFLVCSWGAWVESVESEHAEEEEECDE
jgi:hypothetical protein